MNKSHYNAQKSGNRAFEVATTALARVTANKPVERLSQDQLARLKQSVQSVSNKDVASFDGAMPHQPCLANHRK